MGVWTTQSGKTFVINIGQNCIDMMQSHGARLCWMHDNNGIFDKESDYYEDYDYNGETRRKLKRDITVVCENGDSITGYITHWVRGLASGTELKEWFIIQPGTYPTYCNEKVFDCTV